MDIEQKIKKIYENNSKVLRILKRTLPCLLNSKNYFIPKNVADLKKALKNKWVPETDNLYFNEKSEGALECFVQRLFEIPEIKNNNSKLIAFQTVKGCVKDRIKGKIACDVEQFLKNVLTNLLKEQKQ